MVEYLNTIPDLDVVILDNESKYEPLLAWYETKPCIIERLPVNYGNFVLWSAPTAIPNFEKPNFFDKYKIEGQQYILSDCDLGINAVPKNFVEVLKEGLKRYEWAVKCGFSLEISDLPDTAIANEAISWEANNWNGKLDDMYFKAPVDTTLALYRGYGESNDFDNCLRTDKPYCARHETWYYQSLPEDEKFYISRLTTAHNHYSIKLKHLL